MEDKERWPYEPGLKLRALRLARSYEELKKEAEDLLTQAPCLDGQPRGTGTSDPTAAAAIRREAVICKIELIEDALSDLEPWYRDGIRAAVFYDVPLYLLEGASEKTWLRKRAIFLAGIVRRAGWAYEE